MKICILVSESFTVPDKLVAVGHEKEKKKASLEQAQLVYPFIKSSVGSCRFSGQESDFLFDRKSAMFFFFFIE